MPKLVADRDDPWAGIDSTAQSLDPLLEMVKAKPPRVQPSKKVASNWDDEGNPVTPAELPPPRRGLPTIEK